ncbi:MAG: AbgT family transporter [Defluviitaleaceae bacterium]|nr:AbgT family transporter [Defluviitaleaceae bacterium]
METKKKKTTLLDKVERVGNKLPHPAVIFIILAGFLMVLSAILAVVGVSVDFTGINMATGNVEHMTVSVRNLLSVEGLEFMLTSTVRNFTGFAPLGVVLVAMLGIGIADGSGLLTTALKRVVTKTPRVLLTTVIVFVGILSCLASDAGYVIVIPLAAIIFMSVGRHPIAGLAAGFAGVAGGFGASLLLSPVDAMIAGLTTEAAQIVDPNYIVGIEGNWFFGIASVFLLTALGTFVTEKIVEPRLGKYEGEAEVDTALTTITPEEKRGLRFAGITGLITLGIILVALIPQNGPLRGTSGAVLTSPFMTGLVVVISLFFAILGIAYGIGKGSIKKDKDVVVLMENSIKTMAGFIVLAFFAAQFIAYFSYTNLGTIVAVGGADMLVRWGISGIPLILGFMVIVVIVNFLIGSMSAKWAILGPVFVPMLMGMGFTPEFVQAAYRVADSTTNIISPLMAYFALIVVFFQKYDKKAGVGTLISTMMPYTVIFTIGWTALLIVWYIFGWNVGPGVGVYLP